MLKKLKNNLGLASIVEVTVTAIIFMVAAAGIFSSISSLRPEGKGSADKLEAAYQGRQFLDEMRQNLSSTTWTGQLAVGTYGPTPITNPTTGRTYTFTYTVSAVPGINDVRKVDLTVDY